MNWQKDYLKSLFPLLRPYQDYCGTAALGSYAYGDSDEYSDLDLLVVHNEKDSPLSSNIETIASAAGELLTAYRGGHIGKINLLVCLYDNPVRRVDLTFVDLPTYIADQVQQPRIVDDPEKRLAAAADRIHGTYPPVNHQYIEDRFWVWIINCVHKIQRGDVFDAIGYITSIRKNALQRLIHDAAGSEPRGYRNLHTIAPDLEKRLRTTHPGGIETQELIRAVDATIQFYLDLRDATAPGTLKKNTRAQRAALKIRDSH